MVVRDGQSALPFSRMEGRDGKSDLALTETKVRDTKGLTSGASTPASHKTTHIGTQIECIQDTINTDFKPTYSNMNRFSSEGSTSERFSSEG